MLISAPDQREGHDDIDAQNEHRVQTFWAAMMDKHGTEKQYNRTSSTPSSRRQARNHHRRGQAADRLRRAAQHGAVPRHSC